jgi:hypothetical protein
MKLKTYLSLLFFGTKNPGRLHYFLSPIFFIAFLWVALICYPNMLFAYSTQYGQFSIHSTQPINSDKLAVVLNKVNSKIKKSEIYSDENRFNIFLCDNLNWTKVLNPLQSNIYFAWTNPVSRNVTVLKADIENDLCYSAYVQYTQRPLSDVVAHELCHVLQYQASGLLKFRKIESWKLEGYADYIGISNDFNLEKSKLWIKDKHEESVADHYINSYVAVSYLISKKGWTYTTLIESDITLQEVLNEIENSN